MTSTSLRKEGIWVHPAFASVIKELLILNDMNVPVYEVEELQPMSVIIYDEDMKKEFEYWCNKSGLNPTPPKDEVDLGI